MIWWEAGSTNPALLSGRISPPFHPLPAPKCLPHLRTTLLLPFHYPLPEEDLDAAPEGWSRPPCQICSLSMSHNVPYGVLLAQEQPCWRIFVFGLCSQFCFDTGVGE